MQAIEKLTTPKGEAVTLTSDCHVYMMRGPTGVHTLPADCSAERLAAHWAGFCSMNDVENFAQREAKADPKRVPSSYRVMREVARGRCALATLEARLDDWQTRAERFECTWADHGDTAHLLAKLLELNAPDADFVRAWRVGPGTFSRNTLIRVDRVEFCELAP